MAGEPSAVGKMKEWFVSPASIASLPDAVLATMYMASVRYGGRAEWEQVFSIYSTPATPAHRDAAIAGLTASRDLGLVQRTVDFVFGRFWPESTVSPLAESPTGIRCSPAHAHEQEKDQDPTPWHPSPQNAVTDSDLLAFCTCMARQPTLIRSLLFQAVREHWSAFRAQMEGGFIWSRLILTALSSFSSKQDLEAVKQFVHMHPEVGVSGAQALEAIASSNRWLKACKTDVQDWLQSHGFDV